LLIKVEEVMDLRMKPYNMFGDVKKKPKTIFVERFNFFSLNLGWLWLLLFDP